jgi:RNA polymerase sigma factor (sigma-70 family)
LSDATRFADLVLPHLDAGYNLARWLARDPHDAEDVVQDACVRALKYASALHGSDGKAWFLTIVRHAFYDWQRRNRALGTAWDGQAAIDDAPDTAPGPEQAAIRNAELRLLADVLASLPLPFREVLVLRELEELSYREIARIVDIPIGTVMSRLARARSLLQGAPALRAIDGRTARGAP